MGGSGDAKRQDDGEAVEAKTGQSGGEAERRSSTSAEALADLETSQPLRAALTDTGNVKRLLQKAGRNFRWVEKWNRFAVWDGRVWVMDTGGARMLELTAVVLDDLKEELDSLADDDPRRASLRAWHKESQSVGRRKAVVELSKASREARARPEDFDARPWLLCVANGTLDLSGEEPKLRKHSPTDYLTVMSDDVRYGTDATAPTWDAFLARVIPDADVRAFLQRFMGYALTGSTEERLMLVCIGEQGNNGKSVFLRAASDLLGPYARSAKPEHLIARKQQEVHQTYMAELFGRRLVTMSELRQGRVWDEEETKRITGGTDAVKARRMHEDQWEFYPRFKMIMAANHRPTALDMSNAFWRRLAIVPWEVSIPVEEEDKRLSDKLRAELPGILNWALEGFRAWRKGGLEVPEVVKAAGAEYRRNEDKIGQFVAECLTFDSNGTLTNEELAASARKWCEQHGLKPFGERSLGERLRRDGRVSSWRSTTKRGHAGIRLTRPNDLDKLKPN